MNDTLLFLGVPWKIVPDEAIKKVVREILEGAGYDFTGCYATASDRPKFTEVITSRSDWEVAVIGYSVRESPQLTVFVEWLVNEVNERALGAKIPEAKGR